MCHNHFNPLRCIVPPYMLDKLVISDNNNIADPAINSSFRSHRFRSDRIYFQQASVHTKKVLGARSATAGPPVLNMVVYDNKHRTDFSRAKKVWDSENNQSVSSRDARNVIEGGKASWDFYYSLFGRNSIDNNGFQLNHYFHYDRLLDNAYWDGRRMIYGDGDHIIFASFTSDMDIIGHELTHGVTENEANLDYENQPGALNESFSDIFGILIKQRSLNHDVKKANWLIGEKVLKGKKYALRSMKEPGKAYVNHPILGSDPQPATMDDYVNLPNTPAGDYGGVHINSGIPNYAFYVTAFNIGGYAWEKAGRIWYSVLTDKNLLQNADFIDVKNLCIFHAESLYGIGSLEVKAVKQGWDAAKV